MKNIFISLLVFFSFTLNAQQNKKSRGIYNNYSEFKNNQPAIRDSFIITSKTRTHHSWEGTLSFTPRYASSNKKIKKIWGFSDEYNTFVFHQGEFFQLKKDSCCYYFIGYDLFNTPESNSSVVTAAVLGGAIGGGIASSIAVSKAKSRKIKYTINPETGDFIHPTRPTIGYINTNSTTLIIYRREKKEMDIPVNFSINDSLNYSFIPNSFTQIRFDSESKSIILKYGAEMEKMLELQLQPQTTIYLCCSYSEKDNTIKIIEVEKETGEFDSYKPEKVQRKRDKLKSTPEI